ncbi:GGDEF domain-containing protein [Marinitoga litoralis]|uniref:GGDEF domain-containing protein n=1 Tax=Marinitoga litoralis TaxID=570855 RepID=UPI0019602AD1|nr:GGDEF domain-containing protein [Marinitoga litoralis]MBM7558789.1 diguanylate cyclase (GGDEF)-like protein [Marinitoga litoralis]
MNKKNLRNFLFTNTFFIVLFLGILMVISLFISSNILFKNIYDSTIQNSVHSISELYNENMKYFEYFSSKYQDIVSEILDELYKNYINNIPFSSNLTIENFRKIGIFKNVDYYIINKNGIIIETSYDKDLGLNLANRVPNYWKKLNEELNKNNKYIEGISYEIKTNNPRIYGYLRMEDGNIFEIGILIDERAIPNFPKTVSSLNLNFIKSIYTYNISFIPYSFEFPLLDEEDKNIFNSLEISKGEIKTYTLRENSNGKESYVYIKWVPDKVNNKEFNFTVLTKISIDLSSIVILKNSIIFIFIVLIFFVIFSLALYLNYMTNRIEKPIMKLINNIESGKVDADAETNILEIDTLIKYYSHLVNTLVEKLKEEERDYLELKEKLQMIEKEKDLLYEMALKDDLTKLFNKKGSVQIIQKLVLNKESFSVIYLDIDNYNNILEKLGQNEANDAILSLVEIMKTIFRDRDFIFRVDENEFLILLRFVNLSIAQKILKRFVDALKKFNITSDKPYKISVSYGIIEYKGQNIEDLYNEARNKMEMMKMKKLELLKKLSDVNAEEN